MPKTRNVTRSQWSAANNTSHSTRDENKNPADYGSEKENAGKATRQTRSHRRTGLAMLPDSATTVLGASTAAKASIRLAAKGKGPPKGKPLPVAPKQKKQPLQDITSQFLPAPESANRGAGYELADDEESLGSQHPTNLITAMPPLEAGTTSSPLKRAHPVFASPLPPSSPPSDLTSSPVFAHRKSSSKPLTGLLFSQEKSLPEASEPWLEFDDIALAPERQATPTPAGSNSDPFGFVALERKLKHDREIAAAIPDFQDDIYAEDDYEDLGNVLVADTSSPRPVRRLKRVHDDDAEEEEETPEARSSPVNPAALPIPPHPHFATPPTPHKDKQKRRRLSHEGRDVFSPASSSVESSPSPTKVSARKRPFTEAHIGQDPLDEFNEELERSLDAGTILKQLPPAKRTRKAAAAIEKAEEDNDAIAKNLRPRRRVIVNSMDQNASGKEEAAAEKKHVRSSVGKGNKTKKPVSKSRSTAPVAKREKPEAKDNEEDLDEKWEKQRLERVEYFKRLEGYQVEKEDVYLI